MNTRTIWTLLATTAVALALAGCSKPETEVTQKDSGANSVATPANPEKAGADATKVTDSPEKAATDSGSPTAAPIKGEPAKVVAPEGDATKYAGSYQMVIGDRQAKLNTEMKKRKLTPFAGTITIDGKGGYTFQFGPQGKQRETVGTTQVKGDQISLTPQKVEGVVPTNAGEKRAMVFKLGKDGKTLEPQGELKVKFQK